MKNVFERVRAWFRRKHSPTRKIYILQTDFPLKPEAVEELNKTLDSFRDEYGLDFLVLEPGYHLRRFDDI